MLFKGISAENYENIWKKLIVCNRPIVVWGTLELAKITIFALKSLNDNNVAVGDNNIDKHGTDFYGYTVFSAKEVSQKYPNAIIVITASYESTICDIKNQLLSLSNAFDFCRSDVFEYIYETKVLKRELSDCSVLARVANNKLEHTNDYRLQRPDPCVLPYFCYYDINNITDMLTGIYSISQSVFGIKTLDIHINSEDFNFEKAELIKKVCGITNILHVWLVIDDEFPVDPDILDRISNVICGARLILSYNRSNFTDIFEKCHIYTEITRDYDVFEKRISKPMSSDSISIRSILKLIERETGIHSKYIDHNDVRLDEPVKIVLIGLGLGNQIAMYLFGKMIEKKSGYHVLFDDSPAMTFHVLRERNELCDLAISKAYPLIKNKDYLEKISKDVLEIGCMFFSDTELFQVSNAFHDRISLFYDNEQWFKICQKLKSRKDCILDILSYEYSINLFIDNWAPNLKRETTKIIKTDDFHGIEMSQKTTDDLLTSSKINNCYYHGGFSTTYISDWLIEESEWCRKQIKLKGITEDDINNYDLIQQIQNSVSVGIHVRRGDFVTLGRTYDKFSSGYYNTAVNNIRSKEKHSDLKFFVISNGMDWCMDNPDKLGLDKQNDNIVFVAGNDKDNSYKDMVLLSSCQYIIPCYTSSFSFCAIALSEKCKYYAEPFAYIMKKSEGLQDNEIYCLKEKYN